MRVAWVHPSWRDLVIEQLAADPARRRRFLERCGPPGVALALSTRGGKLGERRLPLMGSDADWDALGDRLHELLGEVDLPDLLALLATLREALVELARNGPELREATGLAEAALGRVARRWDAAREPIPLPGLEAWLEVAAELPALPELPSLALTWAELLPVRPPPPPDPVEVQRFTDWLTLCRLLWDCPPAWEVLDFGREQVLVGADFVDLAARAGERCCEQALTALEAIAGLMPDLRRRVALARARIMVRKGVRVESAPSILLEDVVEPEELGDLDVVRVLSDL